MNKRRKSGQSESGSMTFDEFMERMLTAFPKATCEPQDDTGELVIYTNLRYLRRGRKMVVVPCKTDG